MAEVRIFNPDGSEAELSGNGVRQAVMYLRQRGWTDDDEFSVRTAAGEVRPRIDGELCTMDIGRARLRAEGDYPTGADDGRGTLTSDGREFELPVRAGGQPAGARSRSATSSRSSTSQRYGPGIERNELFPQPHQRRRSGDASGDDRDPRAHLRARRGGDDGVRHRRDGRRGGGHAARSREPGHSACSTAASS